MPKTPRKSTHGITPVHCTDFYVKRKQKVIEDRKVLNLCDVVLILTAVNEKEKTN